MSDSGQLWLSDVQRLRLGEIEIDLRYRCVHRGGTCYELNPRCFDLLLLFLREPRVLQTREAIFRKVWSGMVVEDASLTNCIWLMRRAFGGAAKQWIRTVPKHGYVFDPPAHVHLEPCSIDETAPEPGVVAAPSAPSPPDEPMPVARAAARVRPSPFAAAAAVVLALVLGGAALLRADGTAQAPRRIALIAATEGDGPDDARWPTTLLHGWLDWQVRSLPQVTVTAATDTCPGCTELAVVLSVARTSRDDGQWQVAARFRGPSPPPDIVRAASTEKLVATLDDVSRDVLRAIDAGVDRAVWPSLPLDAAAAAQLADGLDAERRHRWSEATRAYTNVVDKAPAFGFARLRLGESLAVLGQQGAAEAELKRATSWIDALPAPLLTPVKAQQALVLRDYGEAASAYATLRRDGGDTTAWRLAEAQALRGLGRSQDAAGCLAGEPPAQPSPALRWHMQRTETEIANRDLRRAIRSARAAMEVASRFGWEHERARATLILVVAQAENAEPVDRAGLDLAARAFDQAGDKLGALRARLYAEIYAADNGEPSRHLDELLAEARLAGNAAVEIDALRRVALYNDRNGNIDRARERLAQAAAVAESAGDIYSRRQVELNLLYDEVLRLDFAAVDRRLERLRTEPLQGRVAYAVGFNTARLSYLRGRFDDALATLRNTEDVLRAGDELPQIAFTNGCLRIAIHMMQGRTSAARNDIRECRASGLPAYDHFADIASAELAIHAGDLAEARRLLAPMRDMLDALPNRQDRWNLAIEVGPLLARVGELDAARALIDGVLPDIARSGYHLLEANARVTRAEIGLALGHADEAERDVAAAEALVPPDEWYERRRIRTVRALLAQARGAPAQATQELTSLHADALAHGDVLAELLVHSVMAPGTLADDCSDRRHAQLLAESGMRGASDIWMNPAAHSAEAALANARGGD